MERIIIQSFFMKRIKWLFVVAVVVGVTGAFTINNQSCLIWPQYYWNGGWYSPAAQYGYDYYCEESFSETCTYVYDGFTQQYRPCRQGIYTRIWPARNNKSLRPVTK